MQASSGTLGEVVAELQLQQLIRMAHDRKEFLRRRRVGASEVSGDNDL